jgi:3-oxoacyl-[acyl-carrier protein] reductase
MGTAQQKTLFLTGSTGGLGSSIAELFARRGWNLCLFGRDSRKLAEASAKLSARYKDIAIKSYELDLGAPRLSQEAVSMALEENQSADALVHAGGVVGSKVEDVNLSNWHNIFSINVESPFFISRKFANFLISKNLQGSIVTISSSAAFYAGKPDYAASKLALVAITRSLAHEYAKSEIRVNCIAPGYVNTEALNWDEEKIRKKVANVPLGRLANPSEIASVCHFLCSEESSYITGAVIDVNGGLSYR